jgi:hypothetical protein
MIVTFLPAARSRAARRSLRPISRGVARSTVNGPPLPAPDARSASCPAYVPAAASTHARSVSGQHAARAGRLDDARLAFEKMLTYANHLGLYAEQISRAGEQQGNFPQALTHLALISAAFNLDRALD